MYENDDLARIPLAKFVTGDARLEGDEDGDSSDVTESTQEPSTDEEEIDDVSLLSWGSGEHEAIEPRWTWESNSQFEGNEWENRVEFSRLPSSLLQQRSH